MIDLADAILRDDRCRRDDWDGLAFVLTALPGDTGMTGYAYMGDEWEARTPKSTREAVFELSLALQDAMAAETGRRWKQALIHITRPGPEIDIQFEYDDPTRWSLKKVSLDLADYAESLRPRDPALPAHPHRMHDREGTIANDLFHRIGSTILNNARIRSEPWDALSFVSTITPDRRQMNGYRYEGDQWEATLPKGDTEVIMDALTDLQDTMATETRRRWKQALIHVTRPGPEIDIQFEYDDPTRWSLKKFGLDLADYAESLRPPRPGVAR